MSFGLFSHPFASFGGFEQPFFVDARAHPFFAASSSPFVVRPRRRPTYALCNAGGRCGPWRRAPVSAPSVLEFLTHRNDLESVLEALFGEEGTEAKKLETAPSAAPVAAPSEETVATPSAAVIEAPKRRFGAVEVRESDSGTDFEVALPGLALEDVKLEFDFKRRLLHVKAEKKVEEVVEEEKWGKQTFVRHVSVARSLPIPEGVKPEDVKADFVDGVLSIAVTHKALEGPKEETISVAISSAPASSEPASSTESDEPVAEASDKTEEDAETEATNTNEDESPKPASPAPSSSNAAASVTITPPEALNTETNSATVEDAE